MHGAMLPMAPRCGRGRNHLRRRRPYRNLHRGFYKPGLSVAFRPHWWLSCRFSRFIAPFQLFLRLRDASGPHSRVCASQENAAVGPHGGVFCRGIAARSGRFGVIAFVRPRANRRLGGAYRCFGPRIVALASAKCHLCVRGLSCSKRRFYAGSSQIPAVFLCACMSALNYRVGIFPGRVAPLDSKKEAIMSGHSKWATTKHRKAAQDAKRSALFSKAFP